MRNLFILSICLLSFGQLSSQTDTQAKESNAKILAELEALTGKIAAAKIKIESGTLNDTDDLYEMNYELQEYLDNISEHIYQRNLAEADMVETEEEEEVEMEDEDYKSDKDFSPEFKSKVMKSLNDFSLVFGWGINSLNQDSDGAIDTRLWGSNNWEIGFVNKKQLGKSRSRIIYGLVWNTHTFKLDQQNFVASDSEQEYEITDDNSFDRVKFGVRYLQIPLGIGVKVGKKSEIYFGGHAGVKLKGFTRKDFKSNFGEEVEQEAEYDYGMRRFNYGLDVSFGAEHVYLFGKYDLNPVFDNGPDRNIFTVGLRLGY